DNAMPLKPKIKEIRVEKVSALTGAESPTEMKSLDICGTDLGTMTEIGNRIFFAFGDTFGYEGDVCRGIDGPNWRSNVFASTIDHNPSVHIYAIGTPCGRFGSARLARVRKENLLFFDAWEYFSADQRWTTDPQSAIEIIPAPVGEGSILWNPGIRRWMYTY